MEEYVLGFLFDVSESHVALVRKLKPEWQRGKLNGIGGKVEALEIPHEAMVREFKEETGVDIPKWTPIINFGCDNWNVEVFAAKSDLMYSVRTIEAESIERWSIDQFPYYQGIPNLRWLIPLCLDQLSAGYTLNKRKI